MLLINSPSQELNSSVLHLEAGTVGMRGEFNIQGDVLAEKNEYAEGNVSISCWHELIFMFNQGQDKLLRPGDVLYSRGWPHHSHHSSSTIVHENYVFGGTSLKLGSSLSPKQTSVFLFPIILFCLVFIAREASQARVYYGFLQVTRHIYSQITLHIGRI